MTETKPFLPKTVGSWTRPGSPQLITPQNIFDYMDGAGELYVGYRFSHLESYEYEAKDKPGILVEVYFMKTPDDAFGLLSLDWGGEPIALNHSPQQNRESSASAWPRALYGEGLLRLWSDDIYARIMAYQNTPDSKEAVLALGLSIIKDRKTSPPPELVRSLPDSLLDDWVLRRDKTSYLRSHLVLNSLYYLGQENMLDLGPNTEAVTVSYEKTGSSTEKKRIQFLLVKYPDSRRARSALDHFNRVYLSEIFSKTSTGTFTEIVNTFAVEDGWLGYKLRENTLTFIFECPDQKTALAVIRK